jgi:hypothetical protein
VTVGASTYHPGHASSRSTGPARRPMLIDIDVHVIEADLDDPEDYDC